MVSKEMLELGTARSLIRELFEYGKERAAIVGADRVYDFSLGNPSTPPPGIINARAMDLLEKRGRSIHGYTSAAGDLLAREGLAAELRKKSGKNYEAKHLYLTMGAAAGLTCAVKGLCCDGDEFVILAPYFPEYKVFIQGNGGKVVEISPNQGNFQANLPELEAKITKNTKAIIINSPNNPSGVIYSAETLEKMGEILRKKSAEFGQPIYLISDEPYRELVYDGEKVPWVADFYDNTIICYSFSKSLSLAGERIGYLLVGEHVEEWEMVYGALAGAGRALGFVNAPSLFQQVVAQSSDLTADLDSYRKNRDILLEGLRKIGFEVESGGAFYLFPKALEEDDMAFCNRAKEFDLLLVPGSAFGVRGYFRLSYCVSLETCQNSLEPFQKLADSYK